MKSWTRDTSGVRRTLVSAAIGAIVMWVLIGGSRISARQDTVPPPIDESDPLLPCREVPEVPPEDCAHFNATARQMSFRLTSVARDLQDVDQQQFLILQSHAYKLAAEGDLSENTQQRLRMTLDRYLKAFEILSNAMNKISSTQDAMIANLK